MTHHYDSTRAIRAFVASLSCSPSATTAFVPTRAWMTRLGVLLGCCLGAACGNSGVELEGALAGAGFAGRGAGVAAGTVASGAGGSLGGGATGRGGARQDESSSSAGGAKSVTPGSENAGGEASPSGADTGSGGASGVGRAGAAGRIGGAGSVAPGGAGSVAPGGAGSVAPGGAGGGGANGSGVGGVGGKATGASGAGGRAEAGAGGRAGTGGTAVGGAGDRGRGGATGKGGDSGRPGTGGAVGGVGGGRTASAGGSSGPGGGSVSSGSEYWIATDGSDSNAGTEDKPFKTLSYAHSKASAGATIWVKPGTYAWSTTVSLTKSGTASSPIRVFAAAGARPVLDFAGQPRDDSSARGIKISGDYWHIKGVDVINAGDNCIAISGSHNTIEWVTIHGCSDSGLQISVDSSQASDQTRGAYNTVLNCDAYENYDQASGGENADGFAAKLHIGPGNVFRGCRAWNNADDGWDLFAADDVVTIDNCWAFLNGKLASGGGTSNGDGNGFKLGGAAAAGDAYEGGAPHEVTRCFSMENAACGFTRNNNTSVPVLSSCGARGDKTAYCSLTNPSPVTFTMTAAQAKAARRDANGSLPAIQ